MESTEEQRDQQQKQTLFISILSFWILIVDCLKNIYLDISNRKLCVSLSLASLRAGSLWYPSQRAAGETGIQTGLSAADTAELHTDISGSSLPATLGQNDISIRTDGSVKVSRRLLLSCRLSLTAPVINVSVPARRNMEFLNATFSALFSVGSIYFYIKQL